MFRNADPQLFRPQIREATGWIVKEDDVALWICFDKPVEKLPYEKLDPSSGLVILKSNILRREAEKHSSPGKYALQSKFEPVMCESYPQEASTLAKELQFECSRETGVVRPNVLFSQTCCLL